MDRKSLETAITRLAGDPELLARFKANPKAVGLEIGISEEWAGIISAGDRDRLRSVGLNDAMTILVSRWFANDLGDSGSAGKFFVDRTTPLPKPDVPANLVFAGACSHVPDLLARPEIDPEDAVNRLLAGFKQLAAKLTDANPNLLIVTTDAHFQSFQTGAFVVGVAPSHTGSMAFFKRPDLDLNLTGEPQMAARIVAAARAHGLEVEESKQIDLDHGLIVPLRLVLPRKDMPVIPIVTQPARTFTPFGARAFGNVLRSVIETSGKRVAILATGGLSHWLDPGKFGKVDVEFDSYILEMMKVGRGIDLSNMEPYPLLDHGQYEFMNWLIMLGAVGPGVVADVMAYEPMQASGGGWAVAGMRLPAQ